MYKQVFVNASISFDAASSTTVDWGVDWVFAPESLSAGARFVWTMPTDCNAPEIACEIIAPSSVGLNCEEDSGGCAELSGRTVEIGRLSARRCFGATAGAGLFAAWRFEARLGGILMKNVHYITATKIKNIVIPSNLVGVFLGFWRAFIEPMAIVNWDGNASKRYPRHSTMA